MEFIKNPQLDGNEFFWKGNRVGFLLIHGFTASTTEVRLLGEKLHKDGYTVSAPLLPGHITSPEDMNQCAWEDWYGAVESHYLDLNRQVDTVFVGGESMGALLTLLLASRQSGHQRIVVLRTGDFRQESMARPTFLQYFVKYQAKGGKEDNLPWKGYTVNPIHAVAQLHELQLQTRKALPSITAPAAIFASRIDTSIAPQSADVLYQQHWIKRQGDPLVQSIVSLYDPR